jgi:hypothetical protein
MAATEMIGSSAAAAVGAKVGLGMAGAAILYLVMPPERLDGTFSKREFAARLAVAGFFSVLLGDWTVAVVDGLVPALKAAAHPAPFWLASGAPGWWVSRAVALWFYKRSDKDLGEMVQDAKQMKP